VINRRHVRNGVAKSSFNGPQPTAWREAQVSRDVDHRLSKRFSFARDLLSMTTGAGFTNWVAKQGFTV